MLKSIIVIVSLGIFSQHLFGSIQYYDSQCTDNQLTVANGLSKITWGSIYLDVITLKKIKAQDNGYIEFQIEPTEDIEVSLTEENNNTKRFGFIFKSNEEALIQIAGVVQALPPISYQYIDMFKVEKCDGQICFYKNDELIYCHCIDTTSSALLHTTHVNASDDTRLSLVFDSQTNCNVALPRSSSLASYEENFQDQFNENTIVKTRNTILVNVYSKDGKAVKQFKVRTDSEGRIPENHQLRDYASKGYHIEIKKDRVEN